MTNSIYLLPFFLGAICGSFINVVVYRLPRNLSLIHPNSFCVLCKSPLRWYENIPIVSYIIQGGKCNHCNKHYSFLYFFIEIISGLIFIFLWQLAPDIYHFIFYSLYALIFLALIFIDYKHFIIPNSLLIPLFILTAVFYIINNQYNIFFHLISAVIVAGVLYILRFAAQFIFKKESFGLGDVKLGSLIGFILGWKAALIAIFFGFLIAGMVIIIFFCLRKISRGSYIPFGPFMILGMVTYLLWGKTIVSLYLFLFLYGYH